MIERFFRKYILGVFVWAFFKALSSTWRVVVFEPDDMKKKLQEKSPLIFAHWHGDEVALIYLVGRYKLATITSTSKDGEMMNTVIRLLGGKTSRGSSTRGGVNALKGLIRIVKKENRPASFAVDGPKGPIHQVKPGIFEFSRLTGGEIFCVGVACDRKWVFEKAWNKAYLPKPFAKIHIHWVGHIGPIGSDQDPRNLSLALEVKKQIETAAQLADQRLLS